MTPEEIAQAMEAAPPEARPASLACPYCDLLPEQARVDRHSPPLSSSLRAMQLVTRVTLTAGAHEVSFVDGKLDTIHCPRLVQRTDKAST